MDVLWQFDEKDPDDPSTWYTPQRRDHTMTELNNTGMLEIYNHQALWDTRMEPRVYDAFVDIWDREDLWVTIDRANLNPPNRMNDNPKGFIHWDVDTSVRPLPIGVQGVLSLLKQDAEVGGFQCVPELFSNFDEWVETQPADRDPMHPDTTGLTIVSADLSPAISSSSTRCSPTACAPTTQPLACAWRSTSRCTQLTGTTRRSARSAFVSGANWIPRSATLSPATHATGSGGTPERPRSRHSARGCSA